MIEILILLAGIVIGASLAALIAAWPVRSLRVPPLPVTTERVTMLPAAKQPQLPGSERLQLGVRR